MQFLACLTLLLLLVVNLYSSFFFSSSSLDDQLDCASLPLCFIDTQSTSLSTFDAVEIMRKRSVVFVGDQMAHRMMDTVIQLITAREEHVNDKVKTQRIGSSKLTFAQFTDEYVAMQLGKDIQRGSGVDAVVIVASRNIVTNKTSVLDRAVSVIQSAELGTRVVLLGLKPIKKMEKLCPSLFEELKSGQGQLLKSMYGVSKDGLSYFSIGGNSEYLDANMCDYSVEFYEQSSFRILQTWHSFWSRKATGRFNVALSILFAPFILLAVIIELRILLAKLKFRLRHQFVPLQSSPQSDDELAGVELKDDNESEFPNVDEEKELDSENSKKVKVIEHDFEVVKFRDRISVWYTEKQGRHICLSVCIYAAVLLLCYLATFNGRSIHIAYGNRHHSIDSFLATMIIVVAIGFLTMTVHRDSADDPSLSILNREQTEEWKGIMQIGFILYHYFHTEETYNLIRIFIAAYVWMTGYGNFFFFFHKMDFSFARVMKMVLRMNLFVLFLTFTMRTEYMLYYICCLHTFYFFVVYLAMLPLKILNRTENDSVKKGVVAKSLALTFVVLSLLFEIQPLFDFVFGYFPWFYLDGKLAEWWFRARLDHYATWFGMLVAFSLPQWIKFQSYLENGTRSFLKQTLFCASLLIIGSIYWIVLPGNLSKYPYNAIHPYTAWIPILLYILVRNSSSYLRSRNLGILSWMGKITLETYLLQFHVWLTDDAKTVLVVFESLPTVNFIFVSAVYIICSYAIFHATSNIIEFVLPNKISNIVTLKRIVIFSAIIGVTYGLDRAIQ